MRYLKKYIVKDLTKKMVILSGPRQTGKTWLAKILCGNKGTYLNWDIKEDQKDIRNIAWNKKTSLVVLDELHKYLNWKNYLKGIADKFENKPPLLITGSARLETFKYEGDALTGRYYNYHLHPIDLSETKAFLKDLPVEKRLHRLMETGGFPEAFLNPEDAKRLRNDRFDLVLQEDMRDLSRSNSVRGLKLLIELLRERTTSHLNFANLANDIGVSPKTVKSWIELLEKLYIIFLIPPYFKGLARSLRKEPKFYFYDCAAPYSENKGDILENTVACSLLKYCHFQRDVKGEKTDLFYFRDREKREVDFIITSERKVKWCLEVKMSDCNLSPNLFYLHERINPGTSLQLVKNINRNLEIKGVKIVDLAQWLDNLYN